MKLLNSKVMSFEEDCVEYENEQEYLEDLDRRRKRWLDTSENTRF